MIGLTMDNPTVHSRRHLFTLMRRLVRCVENDVEIRAAIHGLLTEETVPQPAMDEPVLSERDEQPAVADSVSDTKAALPCSNVTSVDYREWPGSPLLDLLDIVDHFRLKVDASRWAKKRVVLAQSGADHRFEIAPDDHRVLERARAIGCHLWMNRPSFKTPEPLDLLDRLADWYDVTANAVDVALNAGMADDEQFADSMEVLPVIAEAQSGLRVIVRLVSGRSDATQSALYEWLRAECAEERIFLHRYMKADDAPDLDGVKNLATRIDELRQNVQERKQRASQVRKHLSKLRYLTKSEGPSAEWDRVASVVEQLVQLGVPPSSRDLREILEPVLCRLPETEIDWPKGFQLALREIRKVQNRSLVVDICHGHSYRDEMVQTVAAWLKGKAVVLIGGHERPTQTQAIEEAFELGELVWVGTSPGTSVSTFEPFVARPNVAVVLLAIGTDDLTLVCIHCARAMQRNSIPDALALLERLGVDAMDLGAIRVIQSGLESGFPPCCISFLVLLWSRTVLLLRHTEDELITGPYRRLLEQARQNGWLAPGYVPCPACLLRLLDEASHNEAHTEANVRKNSTEMEGV